jgi:hypothetical protein
MTKRSYAVHFSLRTYSLDRREQYFNSRSISQMAYILCTGTDTPETNAWLNLQKIRCAVLWNYFRLLMLKVVPDIYLDPKKTSIETGTP